MNLTEQNTTISDEQVNKEKPWLLLDPDDYNSRWWIMSNNYTYSNQTSDCKNIVAQIIIQDCNMGGEYFRYFAWFKDDDKRYISVDSKDYFDKPLKSMRHNDIVTNNFTGVKYIVNDKFKNEFIKILEVVKG